MHVPIVINRSAAPINGFMILNRLGMNDQIEPINKNLEFQLQDPFLLYRNAQGVCVYILCNSTTTLFGLCVTNF